MPSTTSISPTTSNNTHPETIHPILKTITEIPGPGLDTDTCSLLGPFALAIQGLMAIIVLGSLLVKRQREKPKRKFRIWTADVSKQVIGQAFVHSLNILISASLASRPTRGNACALYFINIFVDTTLGVFILYLILRFLTYLLSATLRLPPAALGLASGTYPRPFLLSWVKQLGLYLLALGILKVVVVGMFMVGGESLVRFGDRVIEAVSPNPRVQVVVVVMVGPTLLNVLQFLLIDSFIRHTPQPVHELIDSDDENPERPYKSPSEDEEEDEERDDSDADEAGGGERAGLVSDRRQSARSKKVTRTTESTRKVPAALTGLHSYPPSCSLTETRERRSIPVRKQTGSTTKATEGWEDDDSWAKWDEEDGLKLPRKPSSPVELKTGMVMSERDSIVMPSIVVNNSESSR
ncbi:hypothetical protein CROQUDRAFT_654377 [Cronartium quercuum f. sp. fusiforme G11]|uniref:Uncharacterized protein n=1 Tax=Cronartium quercuum f. sp. fusiforme G11 TaxID=708437 RepID=A0A9P6NSN8_9BASI|nr:hypothetical protein CROQUDRAFT_654377 [Cronartium quercuum f. sp. fusiforme G11]